MANVIYVGNYPSSFADDDILNIFMDFEGLVLLRSVRKYHKCYSFILCQDQEQVVDVALTLHGCDIDGRELIVRASDDELQQIIESCSDEYSEENDFVDHTAVDETSTSYTSSTASCYRQPHNPSRLVTCNEFLNESPDNRGSRYSNSHRNISHYQSDFGHKGNNGKVGDNFVQSRLTREALYENSRFQDEETASCASYAPSARSGATSPFSTTSSRTSSKPRGEKFSFVSVINFPLGTTVEELKELFADYSPYKIIIRCNTPTPDRIPTEAVVCFLKSHNATNSIMNLDNTLYRKRVILVTECDDESFISELLKVHKK